MSAGSASLRPMARADAADALRLVRSLPEWFNDAGAARLALDLATHEGLVAEEAGALVGLVVYEVRDETAEIAWLAVERARHGRGLGTLLCDRFEECVRARGVRSVEVSTLADTIDYPPYDATRRFYLRRGFRRVRVDVAHWGAGNDRLLLRKPLDR